MSTGANERESSLPDGTAESAASVSQAGDRLEMPVAAEQAAHLPPNGRRPGEIPPLPDHATPDEKELHWYRYVYQGDHVRQLSLRAVLMGGILGMFMCISNLYTTLKLGWSFGVAITCCVLSYVIWNALRTLSGKRLSQMTILENNCMQSTASAAGMSTGGTLATAVGSLLLIYGYHLSWPTLVAFTFLSASLGVFLAIPLKRQMINIERLPFPSGMAAAETLRSLHSHGAEAIRKAYSLVTALGCGAVLGFFRAAEGAIPLLDRIYQTPILGTPWRLHIRELIAFSGRSNGPSLVGFGFEPGTLMIAAGMFIGLRVSLSMLAGSILLYCVAVPWLFAQDQAMAGVADFVPSFTVKNGVINPTRWALWGGTSIMVFSSLASVALQWRTMARAFNVFQRAEAGSGAAELARVEVPGSWVIAGVVPIGIAAVLLNYLAFNMSILLGVIAVAMSFVLSLVACRATGETDTTPTGAMGKVTQLMYALLAKGDTTVNLMSAGTTAGAAGSAADLLTDLKSGYLLGANPRKQFLAQWAGVFFGVTAIVPAWYLMVPDQQTLEAFQPPATNMWRAMADALTKGLHTVPLTAQYAILIGAVVGIALPILSALWPKAAAYLPSAMGLGLAWVVPFQNSLSFAIGAVIAWVWTLVHRRTAGTYIMPVAAGLIAGESIVLALIAIMATVVKMFL
ncbi:MAG: OPT/YSL family transporter [Phycisphaerae bacterium]|nr:OPT/YSL family transporter [Phycisphaerae bacterium]